MQDMAKTIKAHVFTDVPSILFRKQSPGFKPIIGPVCVTFGLDIPDDIDVLIVYNRASYTIKTTLPKGRTAFIAAEPDVIHPYSRRFLNQFGLVVTTTHKTLETEKWWRGTCWYWFAGIDFAKYPEPDAFKGHDWFSNQEIPPKSDKISIVTSRKVATEYHRQRLGFVEKLIEMIPDHIEVFGKGFRSVDDKADALLPYKYHLAIENGEGPHAWTEKLVDPWLCWAFPFYAGCDNVEDYFPRQSFDYVDLSNPETQARRFVQEIENGRWDTALHAITEARKRVLEEHNLMALIGKVAQAAMQSPMPDTQRKKRYIWSERSLLPESDARGSLPEWALRNAVLAVYPGAELKTVALRRRLDKWRSVRRTRKAARQEKSP